MKNRWPLILGTLCFVFSSTLAQETGTLVNAATRHNVNRLSKDDYIAHHSDSKTIALTGSISATDGGWTND